MEWLRNIIPGLQNFVKWRENQLAEQASAKLASKEQLRNILPGVLGAGGHIMQSLIGGMNVRAMNRYNDPSQQVERVRRAGLPMAALTPHTSGNQSAIPENQLGAAGTELGKYVSTEKTRKEISNLMEILRGLKADTDVKVFDRNVWLKEILDTDNVTETGITTAREQQIMFQINSMRAQQELNKHQTTVTRLNGEALQELKDKGMLSQETQSKIALLGKQMGLIESQEKLTAANAAATAAQTAGFNNLVERMMKNGLSLGEAIVLTFLSKGSASASNQGINIGF